MNHQALIQELTAEIRELEVAKAEERRYGRAVGGLPAQEYFGPPKASIMVCARDGGYKALSCPS